MVFFKQAFERKDHRTITVYIMGNRFDPDLFDQVHRYIDGKGGAGHREKHGHNENAEQEIQRLWGNDGVEIFKIHIWSDWLYDNLGPAVESFYTQHASGTLPLPYYKNEPKDKRPSYEMAINATAGGCANCGSPDNLDPLRVWFRGPVCSQCLTTRNLEVCVQCRAFFSKVDRVESPENPGRYLCPVCAPAFDQALK